MKNRKSIVLLLLLVFAFAGANVLLRLRTRVTQAGDRFALADATSDVRRIRISRRGGPDTLIAGRPGDWRLVEPYAAGAANKAVMRLLDLLGQTPIIDVMADSSLLRIGRTRADFKLEDPALALALVYESGEEARFAFGDRTPSGEGAYAAVEGIDSVFVVTKELPAALDVPPDRFRRRALFPSDAASVTSFSIRRGGVSLLEFSRKGDGWKMGAERAADKKVDAFISDLSSATAQSFVWPVGASNEADHVSSSLLAGYGLDPDSAVTVTLNGLDGRNDRVTFGKVAGDGLVYALVQNGDAIVTVPSALRDFAVQEPRLFTDARMFPVDIRSVDSFSIVADGGLYSLAREKDGDWRLESPVVAAADQEAVKSVLARILSLSSVDAVLTGGVSVSLSTNTPKVMVSRESVLADLTFENLRSREMLRIDPTLVRRIVSLSGETGAKPVSVVYERARRLWRVESAAPETRVSEKGVAAILAAVNPLKASRVARLSLPSASLDGFGLDRPFLTVAIDQIPEDAVRRNILVGGRTQGGRYATIGSSDAVFVIPDETVRQLSVPIVEK